MQKAGVVVVLVSVAAAGLLLFFWLLGFATGIAGSLIHLLLVLALPVGFVGVAVGVVLMIVGKNKPTVSDQPPPPPRF